MTLAKKKPFAVAAWDLDESSGTRFDSVGSNDLTDNNTVGVTSGKFDDAADCTSANNEYLSISDNSDLSVGDNTFMLRAWVRLDNLNTQAVIGKWFSPTNNLEYRLWYNETPVDRFVFSVSSDGSSSTTNQRANNFGAPSTGEWYLLHAWHDHSSDEIGISVNGGTANTKSYSGGVYDGGAEFCVAAESNGVNALDGRIDDVVVLKGAYLDSTERSEDWNRGDGIAFADWPESSDFPFI